MIDHYSKANARKAEPVIIDPKFREEQGIADIPSPKKEITDSKPKVEGIKEEQKTSDITTLNKSNIKMEEKVEEKIYMSDEEDDEQFFVLFFNNPARR